MTNSGDPDNQRRDNSTGTQTVAGINAAEAVKLDNAVKFTRATFSIMKRLAREPEFSADNRNVVDVLQPVSAAVAAFFRKSRAMSE
ncbi:MAG: hypothetical protein ABI128_09030 [Rhodanobacter sp.]